MSRRSRVSSSKFLADLASVHEEGSGSDEDSASDIELRRQHILESMAKLEGRPSSRQSSSDSHPKSKSDRSNPNDNNVPTPTSHPYSNLNNNNVQNYPQMGLGQENYYYSNQEMMMQMMMMRMMMYPGGGMMGAMPTTTPMVYPTPHHLPQSHSQSVFLPNLQVPQQPAFQYSGNYLSPLPHQYPQSTLERSHSSNFSPYTPNQSPSFMMMLSKEKEKERMASMMNRNFQSPINSPSQENFETIPSFKNYHNTNSQLSQQQAQMNPLSTSNHSNSPRRQIQSKLVDDHLQNLSRSQPQPKQRNLEENYYYQEEQNYQERRKLIMRMNEENERKLNLRVESNKNYVELSLEEKKFIETLPPLPPKKNLLAHKSSSNNLQSDVLRKKKKDDFSWFDY